VDSEGPWLIQGPTAAKRQPNCRFPGIKPLSNHDVVAAVTLPDGQIPGTFPAMLDDALSSVSLKRLNACSWNPAGFICQQVPQHLNRSKLG
jgi:hypothetical protein